MKYTTKTFEQRIGERRVGTKIGDEKVGFVDGENPLFWFYLFSMILVISKPPQHPQALERYNAHTRRRWK